MLLPHGWPTSSYLWHNVMRAVAAHHRIAHAEITLLPDCGYFVQEDTPDRIGSMLASFLAEAALH